MARLRDEHRFNTLASEAVAASVQLDARVLLSTSTPLLETALAAEGRRCVVRAP